jgi:NhaP-type Na+/H+ or K+/H+ antiporter
MPWRGDTIMNTKTVVLQLMVTSAMALSLGFFIGFTAFYHIRSFDHAFFDYMHHPTPDTTLTSNVEY